MTSAWMDMDPGAVPRKTRYPPTPPIPVERFHFNVTEVDVSAVFTRLVGTEGAVVSMVSTTKGADLADTFPEASTADSL